MASWIDIFSFLMTTLFFVGCILGILYVVHHVSLRLAATKEKLKNKGITISHEGVCLKTDKRFDRDAYVDATQRGFVKALNAASYGPDSHKHAFLPHSSHSESHTGTGKEHHHLLGKSLRRSHSEHEQKEKEKR